jgi:5-methylcytosine-specific restriction endonuclease McrA
MTFRHIAKLLGVSHQRVAQIYKGHDAIKKSYKDYIKERDGKQCAICESTDELQVHHILGARHGNHPSNLVTLCKTCHTSVDKADRQTIRPILPKFYSGQYNKAA